jgi:hypothetical protein
MIWSLILVAADAGNQVGQDGRAGLRCWGFAGSVGG